MKLFWMLCMLVLVFLPVQAAIVGLPPQITFQNEQKEVTFTLTNETSFPQDVTFTFYTPFQYRIVEGPTVIASYSDASYRLAFFPPERLINTTYQTTAVAEVGSSVFEQPVTMRFERGEACRVAASADAISAVNEEEDNSIDVRVNVSNLSGSTANITDISIRNIPFSWRAVADSNAVSVAPYSAGMFRLAIEPLTPFEGTGIIAFHCNGAVQEVEVALSSQEGNTIDALLGLIPFANLGGEESLLLDVLLFIVAVVLLSSFVNRYLKRYAEQQTIAKGGKKNE